MPRVRIESALPMEEHTSLAVMDNIMDAIVEALHLVPDDRTVSFVFHQPGFFRMKPPYQLFIEIALFRGRSRVVKKHLYQTILQRLHEKHGIEKETVMIFLNEQPRENWGLRGGIPGDEIDFDYQIDG